MVRGLYSSAAGMTTQYKKIDVLSNNISNVSTTGFKENDITLSIFGEELATRTDDNTDVGTMPLCVVLGQETTNLTGGTLKSTGISTDLAVTGAGFFAVESADGGVKYTRGGDFSVDAQGYLALPSGERLLSQNGTALYVGGSNFTVSSDGTVTLPDGTADKIDIYTSADTQNITKRADGLFDITDAAAADGEIKQGWLEDSNTDIIKNMTGLMETTRSFQGCQQSFQVSLETLDKLVTQIGTLK